MIVDRRPLVLESGKLALGLPVPARVQRRIGGTGRLDEYRPGDVVSIHWSWACDCLSAAAVRQLVRATRRAIAHTNETL